MIPTGFPVGGKGFFVGGIEVSRITHWQLTVGGWSYISHACCAPKNGTNCICWRRVFFFLFKGFALLVTDLIKKSCVPYQLSILHCFSLESTPGRILVPAQSCCAFLVRFNMKKHISFNIAYHISFWSFQFPTIPFSKFPDILWLPIFWL